jgi:hypothetical protein
LARGFDRRPELQRGLHGGIDLKRDNGAHYDGLRAFRL